MSDKIIPAHVLRLYAWEVLQVNGVLETIDGLVPIIPLEDEPQIADAEKTYIIYGYSENNDARIPEMRRGSLVFRIKARTFHELGPITNALTRAFEGLDIPASRINMWKSKDEYADAFKNINFKTTDAIYVEGGYPEDVEGGPLIGALHITYSCTVDDPSFVLPVNASGGLWN
jgi:hypothetical protein